MLPVLQITLTPQAAALLARAPQWPSALTRNLVRTLNLENEITVGHIQETRATGKGPFPPSEGKLGVRSGRYRRSVRPTKAAINGTAIESAIGSNVRYAAPHEFGFSGTVQVKSHRAKNAWLDTFEVNGAQVARWESFGLRGKKKKVASGIVQVKAHAKTLNIPARAPIRRGIEDRLPAYGQSLSASIVAAFAADSKT